VYEMLYDAMSLHPMIRVIATGHNRLVARTEKGLVALVPRGGEDGGCGCAL